MVFLHSKSNSYPNLLVPDHFLQSGFHAYIVMIFFFFLIFDLGFGNTEYSQKIMKTPKKMEHGVKISIPFLSQVSSLSVLGFKNCFCRKGIRSWVKFISVLTYKVKNNNMITFLCHKLVYIVISKQRRISTCR